MTKKQLAEHKAREKRKAELIASGQLRPDSDSDDGIKKKSHMVRK